MSAATGRWPRAHMGTAKALSLRGFSRTHVDTGAPADHPPTTGRSPHARAFHFHNRRLWTASRTCGHLIETVPAPPIGERAPFVVRDCDGPPCSPKMVRPA